MDQLKYDSLYSGLVSINKSLGGTQSMPDSEYGAMIDLMETLSGQPVGESGDAYNAVSTVATMAENGELPIQAKLDSVQVDITANGSYEYQPSAYGLDGFSRFTANVNVPDKSRLGVKSVNISENGHQEFHAIDFDLDGFSTIGIDVNVPTSGGGTKVDVGGLGLKMAYSKFSTVPDIFDFNNVTNLDHMFFSCWLLTTIPQFNTSRVTDMGWMFQGCDALESIPLMDCSNVTDMSNMFNMTFMGDHKYLTDIGGFKNLKVGLYLDKVPNLTVQSLMNVINNLYDFVGNGSTTTKTLTLGTTNLNKLTDEQKAVATNKGWQLS